MTRDTLVAFGVAFLAGVAVGVEYMNYAGAAADRQASGKPLIDNAVASGRTGSLLPAPIYCLSTQDGMPLRVMIRHCPDGTPQYRWCQHTCWYGKIERRDVL